MPLSNSERKGILDMRVRQVLKDMRLLNKDTVREILGDLKRVRYEITETLKGVPRLDIMHLKSTLAVIDDKIATYESQMRDAVTGAQGKSFEAGQNLTPDILRRTEIAYRFAGISDELLATQRAYTADLIKNLADEMRGDITKTLRRSILTGEDAFSAARKIDDILGVSKRAGYLNRSDVIARTEIGRMFSVARQAKDSEIAKTLPELEKEWVTGINPRNKDMGGGRGFVSHLILNGQIRKVNEPFDMGNGIEAMYPRDESLPPEHAVNCNCNTRPFMRSWEQ